MAKIWLDTGFVDAKNAKVPVTDRGFLYGDGVFETMRAYAGILFKLDRHLDRLYGALAALKIKEPCPQARLAGIVRRSISVNTLLGAYVRVAVTRGEGRFGITYADTFRPHLVVVAKEFEGYPERMHARGITAGIVPLRQNDRSPLASVKSANFLPYVLARFQAKDAGFDEAILLNTRGCVAEAATSNIFIVKNGALATPAVADGVLPGITRSVVIETARRLGMRVAERSVRPDELDRADEIFLTNSLAELIPVVRVGTTRIGSGRPGPITRLLHLSYQKSVIAATLR